MGRGELAVGANVDTRTIDAVPIFVGRALDHARHDGDAEPGSRRPRVIKMLCFELHRSIELVRVDLGPTPNPSSGLLI
jgi:hypothetical protein